MILPKLQIGLDFHGVVDQRPQYFADFCSRARRRGHRVYIISGGAKAQLTKQLAELHIEYDFIFSLTDYCLACQAITQTAAGLMFSDYLWNSAKADFCHRAGVDIHIDDNPEYCDFFNTLCCCYDKKADKCIISNHMSLNMSTSAESLVYQIERLFLKKNP